mmetsp:Transcript_9919/g.25551  ORF Transcript_9919/g.25551 Transcript_9919/m.25551 type:complete len:200 (-) Transcript_9919:956-1555(-)
MLQTQKKRISSRPFSLSVRHKRSCVPCLSVTLVERSVAAPGAGHQVLQTAWPRPPSWPLRCGTGGNFAGVNMTDDSESDEKGLPRRHELIGGGGGGGPHWTRTPGKPVEKDGRLTREVVEASPGGSRRVTVEHDATPAGEEDPDEKKRRVARNKQASKRARTRLDIEVRCDHGGHRARHHRHASTPPRKHATTPQRVLH